MRPRQAQSSRQKKINSDQENEALGLIADLIKSKSGINLTSEKFTLIETRLRSRLGELKIKSFDEYVDLLGSDPLEVQVCIEFLTTHKTEWFREIVHFQWLKKLIQDRGPSARPLNIWSAACSRGPEVYSLMLLCLKEKLKPHQFRILGTDISHRILDQALELSESSEIQFQAKQAFKNSNTPMEDFHDFELALESSVKFRQLNIVKNCLQSSIQFDLIFLRNVLIYFDEETIITSCRNLGTNLKPGGHLVIGVTETLPKELKEFHSLGDSIYVYRPELRNAG